MKNLRRIGLIVLLASLITAGALAVGMHYAFVAEGGELTGLARRIKPWPARTGTSRAPRTPLQRGLACRQTFCPWSIRASWLS